CGCLTALLETYWLDDSRTPLAGIDDEEGERVAADAPPIVDAHVHFFPDRVFEALWAWFDEHAWPIRYRLRAPDVARFLLDRGVERVVALHYGHKPGMSRALNAFVAELARVEPRIVPLATVLPGEPDAISVLRDALDAGARGVKLHCHVQCFAPDDPRADEILSECVARDVPIVMHAGREPKSAAYKVDAHAVSGARRVEAALERHPRLRLCVPHFGADEPRAFLRLMDRFGGLYLDSTMVIADFFPNGDPLEVLRAFPDRVMFGTDFPNLPYAWDREAKRALAMGLAPDALEAFFGRNARAFFRID
ncbi:MAG TPA: amidohydrolase family protein, partial [Polyangiaceae bacterium]|nr:amidohydrolase family protein [Polyangiaceae bacterium]